MSIKSPLLFLFSLLTVLTLSSCEQRSATPQGLEAVYDANRFRLTLSQQRLSVYDRLLEREVLSSHASDLIRAHKVKISYVESHNSYQRQENLLHSCSQAQIDRADPYHEYFQLVGHFDSPGCDLRFYLRITVTDEDLVISAYTSDEGFNQLSFGFDGTPSETLMGFGSQVSRLNFKGEVVPVWLQRQGIGRGEQPLSTFIDVYAPGASGNPFSSPYVIPYFLSDQGYAMHLLNSEYSRFDFRRPHTNFIHVDSAALKLQFFSCPQPRDCVQQLSKLTGRMQPLPDWVHSGALIGLGGGSAQVIAKYHTLKRSNAPISGIWIDDWTGKYTPADGSPEQLRWNWQIDSVRYPQWQRLKDLAAEDSLHLLGYFNPRLMQADSSQPPAKNLYAEALDKGFLVMRPGPKLYNPLSTANTAGLVNLTNRDAFKWLKASLLTIIRELGLSGWDAGHGENLPADAFLAEGLDPLGLHNLFPIEWARLNREILNELDPGTIFSMDAGFTGSPGLVPLLRLSDQSTSWDEYDGLQSAVIGLINAGLSGQAISYASIGGTSSLQRPIPFLAGLLLPDNLKLKNGNNEDPGTSFALGRREDLLKRWLEVGAFMPVFRTSEGLTPALNKQVYDDGVVTHFSRFSTLFAALAPYRKILMEEANSQGLPLVRHPILQFPDETRFLNMRPPEVQFMLGDSIMVAPKLTPRNRKTSRNVILPAGEWIELWTRELLTVPAAGAKRRVTPAMGEPPVYLLNNARTREIILPALVRAGIIPSGGDGSSATVTVSE